MMVNYGGCMNNVTIKRLALANGFKLKRQLSGKMDLNPYVYDFARAVLANGNFLTSGDVDQMRIDAFPDE